ncbi:rhomboid family intramembrane serine protease [Achromobacter aloeverae]|nr:rhomboid family intramembrane serine protease [Achromobacter aloeverae]
MPSPGRPSLLSALRASKITLLLVLANIAVYAGLGLLDTRAFETLSQSSFLIDWGANVPPLTLSGEYWRLFTSMFLHVGFAHLAMNMLALWSLGLVLEPRMRWPVFLGIYLLSGLCGSLTTALWNRGELMISCGASGAILGLFGAALAYALRDRRSGRLHFPVRNLLMSLVLTFGAGTVFSIDNAAHAGGLVCGFLLALVALYSEKLRPAAAGATLALAGVIAAVALAGVASAYHDQDLGDKLAAARLRHTLRHMGFGSYAAALDGAQSLDACIRGVMMGEDPDGQPIPGREPGAMRAGDLRLCDGSKDGEDSRASLLARYLPVEYANCRAQAADLRNRVTKQAALRGLAIIDRYCTIQPRVYAAVFGQAPADLDMKAAYRARTDMENLLDGTGVEIGEGQGTDEESADAIVGILRDTGPLATALVDESGCPYWSCKR